MAKEFKQYEEHFDVLVMHLRLGDQLYSILHVDKSDNRFFEKSARLSDFRVKIIDKLDLPQALAYPEGN